MSAKPSFQKIKDGPYDLPEARLQNLVELLEGYGRPFMLTSLKTASTLGLLRRIVLICLKNTRDMVYLRKHAASAPLYAGLWDVSAIGSVFAGESPEDAAERELREQLGICGARLKVMGTLPYTDSRGSSLSATFFLAGPSPARPVLDESRSADGMFVDQHELDGLALHQQDMLTPELVWAVQSGWIFRKRGGPFLAG